MHVLDLEEDIEDFLAAVGVDLTKGWGEFNRSQDRSLETENECLDRMFRQVAGHVSEFPDTRSISDASYAALVECIRGFQSQSADKRLYKSYTEEYRLFQMVERKLCESQVTRVFESIEDFLETAQTILQRRKARAGISFEHNVCRNLTELGIPFDFNPKVDGTKPDILIPGKRAYEDLAFPLEGLFMVGLKTTCKDRWRQVLREAPRMKKRHILTLQQGVSPAQLNEMEAAEVTLVVPKALHSKFPPERQDNLLSIEQFASTVRQQISSHC